MTKYLSKKSNKSLILFLFIIGFVFNSNAQQNLTLYGLKETSQALTVNPGFRQKNRVYVSLPLGFQNFYINNSAITLGQMFQKDANDSLIIDPNQFMNHLGKMNFISIDSYNQLFGFGFKVKKNNFVSFNVTNRFRSNIAIPKDLFGFAVYGNGSENYLGKRISFDGLAIDISEYMEYSLGYNRNINSKLTVGGRFKLLSGIANIQTKKSKLGITTDATTFDWTIDGQLGLNSSNTLYFADSNNVMDTVEIMKSPYSFKNLGIGLDLGGSYILTDKIQLSASLLDLGFINWKTNTSNFETNDINYVFKGADFTKLIKKDSTYNFGQELIDTSKTVMAKNGVSNNYKTSLHTKFYLGGSYSLNKYFNASATLYNEFTRKRYRAGLALAMNMNIKNWLSASINYGMYGRAYNNLGFGLSLKGGPIQFFVMSDNIGTFLFTTPSPTNGQGGKGAPIPYNTKNIHVSFGLNVVIGPLKDKDGDGIKDKKDDCPELAGDIKFKGCPDRDNDSIIDPNDICPDIPGLKHLQGCPDKDNDSIADKDDECADVTGLRKFKGCPDTDNDSIIDSKDDCPEIAGLIAFNGCPDTDGDGIKDSEDECPQAPGTLVNHGCPDTDTDGVLDVVDGCIDIAGPVENNGCPWPDTDADGLLDKDDKCPFIFGPIKNQGCPYQDTDEDGILDEVDKCPTVKGVLENNGCPKIEEAEKEILKTAFENLEFNTGNAVIKTESFASLDDLAALLIKKKEWKLQIAGHTDNVGNDQTNLILSKKRSEAVKTYLVSKGVEATRINSIYFGETQPITTNDTEEGRSKNRRVEMTVVFQ